MEQRLAKGTEAAPPAGWTQRVGGLAAIPDLLRSFGVDPAPLFDRVGLARDALDAPDRRAPFAACAALLSLAARETACAHFGVLVGAGWRFADTGLPGELARCSATAREALETFVVYQRLNSQGGAAYFNVYGQAAALGFAVFHLRVPQMVEGFDVAMASLVNGTRELCGPDWRPDEVHLPYTRRGDAAPYRDFFRCPVHFDAERAEMRFPLRPLDRALATADARRKRDLARRAAGLMEQDLAVLLHRSLRLLLLEGTVTGRSIAAHFAMHRRTLQRQLRRRGITFQTVLDEVRYDVARQLLRDTRLSGARIAAAIGFAEPASFTHAFKRWSAMTPAQWREAHVAAADAADAAPAGCA
jgi:AraC-like DNA-binding protein